jgi:hypothetical protein
VTRALLWLALASACLAHAPAPSAPALPGITEIVLEKDCFGCPTGTLLVLRREGTATLTLTGKARQGTVDRVSTGSIPRKDFEKLADLLVSKGFFALDDEYSDPRTADGEWTRIRAVRDGQAKSVTKRTHPGPPGLQAIEQALQAVRAGLTFAPSPPP